MTSCLLTTLEGTRLSTPCLGSSTATTITLSFWIKSNKAATYALSAESGGGRNYSTTYTVDAADTWEHKTITIPGFTYYYCHNK